MRIIYFDICAVIVALTILIALLFRRYTKGRTNVLFILLLIACISSGCLDILDSLFGLYIEPSADNVTYQLISNTIYYIIRNMSAPLYILFMISSMGVWHKYCSNRLVFVGLSIPFWVSIVIILANTFTHTLFYFNENYEYHRGKMMIALYMVAVIYLVTCFALLYKYKKVINSVTFVMYLSFIAFNIIAIIVQRININYRMEIFALSMTLLMTATVIQRPEETMDSIVNTLSYQAFTMDIQRGYSVKRPMNVLFIKIINHKSLRNNLGMDTYNKLLRIIGSKFQKMGKVIDLYTDVYYIDGGGFAIVTEKDKYDKSLDLGRLIVAYLQESFKLNKMEIKLDYKVVMARCPEDIPTYGSFLTFTNVFHRTTPDIRHLIVLSEIMDSADYRMKSELNNIIKDGIVNEKFRMYYQPIYSVKKDKFVSAEALIRLNDEKYGFISPALFIPVAEQSGAIHEIGDFVIEDVCRFIDTSSCVSYGLEYIEINLSVAQCIEPKLVNKFASIIKKYDIAPSQLNLEITETAVDYDPDITDKNIFGLKEMGFTFSLDDYGTGYSNIKRVAMLPLDIVKLDKTFVDEMDDPQMWTVIVNTVSMLKRMNKKILVEGVENEKTLNKFIELGCDYIQGFYFSKPLSESEFIKFIIKENSKDRNVVG